MAKPTEQQVKALEIAHKLQYFDLVQANHLWIQLLKKVPVVSGKYDKKSRQWLALAAYGNSIAKLVGKWYARQLNFQNKAKIPAVDPLLIKYFLSPKDEIKLYTIAKKWLAPNSPQLKGIGFIPLLIWGVIAIVVAFTAYEITDELNTTAEEKKDLLIQTQKTLKELNITGTDAAAIIQSTQAQASAGSESGIFSGIMPKLVVGAILFYLYKQSKSGKNG